MSGPRLVGVATIALLAIFAGVVGLYGTDEAGLRTLVRVTARVSFGIFMLVYTASAARRLLPGAATRWLLRNRRYLGLSFAIAHLLHLDAIWLLSLLLGDAFVMDPATLVGGGLAYLFVLAMAATSSQRAVDWLGARRWQTLHRVGLHWIWFVFAYDWTLYSVLTSPAYLPLAALAWGGLGLRIAARRAQPAEALPAAA